MFKSTLLLALILSPAAHAFDLPAINSQLDSSLSRLNKPSTQASLNVDEAEVSGDRISRAWAHGQFFKSLPSGQATLVMNKIVYQFSDAEGAALEGSGRIDTNLSRMVSAAQWNFLIPQAESLLSIAARQWSRAYGNSMRTKLKVSNLGKDSAGNYVSFHVEASFITDISKLPASIPASAIVATNASLSIDVNLQTGMIFTTKSILNPAAEGFGDKERNLKNTLSRLESRDPSLDKEIETLYNYIDKTLNNFTLGALQQ